MRNRFDFRPGQWRPASLAVAVGLVFIAIAPAQNTANNTKTNTAETGGYSTLDLTIFGGYQWFQFGQGTNAAAHQFGGSAVWGERLSEEFSRYIAVEQGIQIGYNALKLLPVGATGFSTAGDSNTQLYAAGVLNLAPREAKFRPFVLVGPEYVWFKAPDIAHLNIAPGSPAVILPPAVTGQGRTALTYGIGLKINSSPRFAVRFDVRGMRSGTPHFGLANAPGPIGTLYIQGGQSHESSITAAVGITFRFRYHEPPPPPAPPPPPPPPPAPKANVQVGQITGQGTVCAGDDDRLSVTASGWLPDQTPQYQWMVDGSPVGGATGTSFNLPTAGQSGTRSVTVRVSAGDSSATSQPFSVSVNPLTPPTLSFSISPSTVPYGTRVNLAATAQGSSCGGPATISYSGQGVTGNTFDSTALSFDMSNRLKQQSQTVTITATATDQKNQTASATAPVTATLTAQAKRLDDIVFPLNSSRVNNCAKRLLIEELTPMLRADPDAKVILIGHRDNNERVIRGRNPVQVDDARVINSAAVLSAGKGICPSLDLSRIMVNSVGTDQTDEAHPALCGTSTNVKERGGQAVRESDRRAEYRRVEIWFVPGGADMPANLTGLKPAPASAIQAKGCPR